MYDFIAPLPAPRLDSGMTGLARMPSGPQTRENGAGICRQCQGEMKWFRSEQVPDIGVIEHLFNCERCGHIEIVNRPAPPPVEHDDK
jgi:hypothetical protein